MGKNYEAWLKDLKTSKWKDMTYSQMGRQFLKYINSHK